MDLEKLKAELADDPLNLGYATMSKEEVEAAINREDLLSAVGRLRPVSDVWLQLARWGLIPVLKKAAENEASPLHPLAYTIMAFLTNPVEEFDLKDPIAQTLMAGLVSAGVITEEQKAGLTKLSDKVESRASQLGLPFVHYWDIGQARGE